MVTVNDVQFHLVLGKRALNSVPALRRLQEKYHARGKYSSFLDQEEVFHRVPRKMLE